ncbi:hypothetical protein LTR10_017587 [Elasticomyces elasticus]|uniref:Uncharacterized protein n=1 Tax=Exophiala sideris TaxID=1016849 RepID=A0ABR0JP29_9EURO|nr:hypothetical protein LTR10_017587 [Elasticomyces elasticus]KAK5038233.1 hypothetical protein LTS07_001702 [Exophiala sideris]KAK5044217.1 hypothetical protein LTR13_000573 [Exophiala sideris]KAK5067717.1 hypothetical protein LTR69_001706 [Exophiala sideris]KAK5184043.1 hypothetical protein LTR44_003549 [Eurotiomycetes sp. CCFEE 6388]
MAQFHVKESDISVLLAAIQSSLGPIQVDAEKVAKQLGMSLSSIPPKFTAIRKRYNIDIKVVNSGALQRKRPSSPKKRQSVGGRGVISCVNPQAQTQPSSRTAVDAPTYPDPQAGFQQAHHAHYDQ